MLTATIAEVGCSRVAGADRPAVNAPLGFGLADARIAFLNVPNEVGTVLQEIAAAEPTHPVSSAEAAMLAAAMRAGFTAGVFDQALAGAAAVGGSPDANTRAALTRFERAYAQAAPDARAASEPRDASDAGVTADLPMIAAAREHGLALNRANMLFESTRNLPEPETFLTPDALASDRSEVMRWTRANAEHDDPVRGGNIARAERAATARAILAAKAIGSRDMALVSAWCSSAQGRAENERSLNALRRAYDLAGASMWRDYYRRFAAAKPLSKTPSS